MYNILLHFKFTLLTVIFKCSFTVLRNEPGDVASSWIVFGDVSIVFLSGRFVYKLFTAREVLLSSESNTVFWVIPLSTACSFRFPPPNFIKTFCQHLIEMVVWSTGEKKPVEGASPVFGLSANHINRQVAPCWPQPSLACITNLIRLLHRKQFFIDVSFSCQRYPWDFLLTKLLWLQYFV